MKTSLKIRILLSYMAIIVLLTVVFILVTNQIINRRFNILTNQVGERNAQWAAEALADYYRVNDSWEGLNGILDQSRTPAGMMNRMSPSLRMFRRNWLDGERGEGLIILDEKGEVLGYNTRDETIARILGDRKDRGVPVIVDGEVGPEKPESGKFDTQIENGRHPISEEDEEFEEIVRLRKKRQEGKKQKFIQSMKSQGFDWSEARNCLVHSDGSVITKAASPFHWSASQNGIEKSLFWVGRGSIETGV